MSPADLSIREAGRRLRDGSLTSAVLTEAHLDRIEALNGDLRAFTLVTSDRARADAANADRELREGRYRGPLHGIPVGIKDLIDTSGIETTSGTQLRRGHIPKTDAAVVTRLTDGGAVLVGKLSLYEFATVGPDFATPFPPARNPWSFDHITGGSSSGNASAVAGGLLRTTIGSDTAGSVRGPASYCGVVGLKPTLDLVPTGGAYPLSPSLDHLGPISRSVEDAALTLDVIAGREGKDSTAQALGQGIETLRIGYARDWFAADPATAPEVLAAVDEAVSTLSLLGARIEEVDLPPYESFLDAGSTILNAESYALHRADLAQRGEDYGPMSRKSLLAGATISPAVLETARGARVDLKAQIDADIFARFDALVTVTTLTTALPLSAFEGGKTVWTPMRTIAFNVTGHPVLSVPVGFHDGLPIGLQIVGPWLGEASICRIGHAFEQATDHSAQSPLRWLSQEPEPV
jgi:aspartyl-tRNA(Asn)/glutamyl-tRNA(Gln) amidotransferase subunit A